MKNKPAPPVSETAASSAAAAEAAVPSDHGLVVWGWWSLLVYLSAGIGLEALHGLKVGWYLDVGQETVRLMLRLGHAHGTLLSLVVLLAGCGARLARPIAPTRGAAWAFKAAVVLLPLGFWLGAIGVRGGDPGPGIIVVPLGALLLLGAVAGMGLAARRRAR